MRASLKEILQKEQIMVIDGSMSTALEALGADLNNTLWTASVLKNRPELIRQVHYDYFKAGADCGITCSYQATIPGLMKAGCTRKEAEALITRSVTLFKEARDQWWKEEGETGSRMYPLCLGSVGPYGASLADGSEYTGNYSMDHDFLYDFHYRRMELLHNAGADLLLIETQPALKEALVAAEIAEVLNADYWISFTCKNGTHTCAQDSIRECAEILSQNHPHLKMIGINCTKPEYVVSLITELKKGTDLPIGVYPNSGETYDPLTKTWSSDGKGIEFGSHALSYMMAGADAVGGCCTTSCTHIREVAAARETYLQAGKPKRIPY